LPGTLRLYDGAETSRLAAAMIMMMMAFFFSETRFPFLDVDELGWVGVVGYVGTLPCVHKVLLGT
jgi:hypothetical protein